MIGVFGNHRPEKNDMITMFDQSHMFSEGSISYESLLWYYLTKRKLPLMIRNKNKFDGDDPHLFSDQT